MISFTWELVQKIIVQKVISVKAGAEFPKEQLIDHNGRDQKSHIFKHSSEKCHQHCHTNSFKITGNGFKNKSFKRKVSEALLIKQIKPSLNVPENSIHQSCKLR